MRARGFTLLEMLVTLAVVGLSATLIWQALAQMAAVEQRLGTSQFASGKHALQRAWVEQAIAGVMTGPEDAGLDLTGRADGMRALTTLPPVADPRGPELVVLELNVRNGLTRLQARRHSDAAAQDLWVWAGPGRFEYLGAAGQWHDRWPPDSTREQRRRELPLAIRLIGPPDGPVLAALVAQPSPLLMRRNIMADDQVRR